MLGHRNVRHRGRPLFSKRQDATEGDWNTPGRVSTLARKQEWRSFPEACSCSAGGSEWLSNVQRIERYKYAAECLHGIGELAVQTGVPFLVVVLNRYEDSLLHTSAQGCELMNMTAHPSVGIHLDTFHMGMEESSIGDAIRLAGKRLFHLHASESHRGTPGCGYVPWSEVAEALTQIDYQGFATVESFNPRGRLAPMARAWRPYAKSQDDLAGEGLMFLRKALRPALS